MIGKRTQHTMASLVGVLVVIGVGASASYYLREPINPGFNQFPLVVGVHVILGGLYLACVPWQFVTTLRMRWPGYHRWAGRLLVVLGLVVGLTGFFIAVVIPASGWWERLVIGFFACFFLFALMKSYVHVRHRRFAQHREWMIRAFAIGLAIATMRVIFIPALILLGPPTMEMAAMLSIISFFLAFTLYAAIAEVWIAKTRGGPRVA